MKKMRAGHISLLKVPRRSAKQKKSFTFEKMNLIQCLFRYSIIEIINNITHKQLT